MLPVSCLKGGLFGCRTERNACFDSLGSERLKKGGGTKFAVGQVVDIFICVSYDILVNLLCDVLQ